MEKPKISESSSIWYDANPRRNPKLAENTKGKQPTGRNVGKLMLVMSLPVDVFLEIASHLHPLDLLHLARVSNELRGMLMSRQMRSVWVVTRKGLEPPMPDCPNDLSEPQYIALVLEHSCMACGVGRAFKVGYAAHIRFCGPCWKANVRGGTTLAKAVGIHKDAGIMEVVFSMVPAAKPNLPHIDVQSSRDQFYEAEFVAVVEQYKETLSTQGVDALKQYVEDRQTLCRSRINFKHDLVLWESQLQQAKTKSQTNASMDRKAAIIAKLEELGYKEKDLPRRWQGDGLDFYHMLEQPRPLTPRIWSAIRPKLITMLEAERVRMASEAFKSKWSMRLKQLGTIYAAYLQKDREQNPWKRTLPSVADALILPCILDLVSSAEPQENLTEAQFLAIEAEFIDDAKENYSAKVRRDLVAIIKARAAQKKQAAEKRKAGGKKAPSASTRRKGKQRAETPPDEDEDEDEDEDARQDEEDEREADPEEAADLALLDQHTSVFECQYYCCTEYNFLSYPALLEHLQGDHEMQEWDSRWVPVAVDDCANDGLVPVVLDILGLPRETGLLEMHRVLSAKVGEEFTCTCGLRMSWPKCPRDPTVLNLGELVDHFEDHKERP